MSFVEVTVTGADEAAQYFFEASADLRNAVHVRLELVCQWIADYARSIAPRKKGEYAESIYYETIGECKFIIGARAGHAAVIEFGSMPHWILPVRAQALRFEVDGEVVFAKYVMHPGTAPMLIIHRAKIENYEKIVQAVHEGVQEVLQKR